MELLHLLPLTKPGTGQNVGSRGSACSIYETTLDAEDSGDSGYSIFGGCGGD
jgi:hypothetical protein